MAEDVRPALVFVDELGSDTLKHRFSEALEVSDRLGLWIEAAQAEGQLNPRLPAIAVLYTLYARACDPVLEFLKMGGQHGDAEIIELVLSTCFDGLNAR